MNAIRDTGPRRPSDRTRRRSADHDHVVPGPWREPEPASCLALHYNVLHEASMDEQLTVRISAELGRALRRASRRLQRKNSDIVRLALQAFLETTGSEPASAATRVKHLVG